MAPQQRRASRAAVKAEESPDSLSPTPSTTADTGTTSRHTTSGIITPATSIGDDTGKANTKNRQTGSPEDAVGEQDPGFSIVIPRARPSRGRFALTAQSSASASSSKAGTSSAAMIAKDDDDDVKPAISKRRSTSCGKEPASSAKKEIIDLSINSGSSGVSSSGRPSRRVSSARKSYKDEPSDDSELSDVPLASTSKGKAKGKAKAPELNIADDLANYDMSDDIEDADEDDFKPSIKFGKKRSASGPSRSKQRIEDEDDSDSELSYIEDEAEDLLAKPRAKGRQRRAPRKSAASLQDREFDGDDDYEDSEDSEDEDFVDDYASHNAVALASADAGSTSLDMGASTSANPSSARGLHGEDIRYETFKQRQARLKSERHLARRKKVPKLTPYQKTVQSLGKHHPELVGLWDDLKQTSGAPKNVATVQPNGLKATLLPFQLEGLNWLLEQEKGPWSGGVLADEMGMGKTIQMISLFLSNRDKPTLVVAPVVAIMQWRNEIAKYTDGFKVLVWHGASREVDAKKLAQHDVVLTSYSVMEASFRKQEIGFKRKKELVKEKSALHAVQWHRVVLDEAHNIKDRATNTAKAAFELSSTYRWCLSGTPLMNRVGELYSMIRFLNGDPYGYYYCKQCPCKSLHWQFSDRRSCDKCGHTPMHHVCFWNISVLRPIQRDGTSVGEGGEAFRRLRILLDRMMLRRTKLERADDMGLPPRTVVVRKDYFNEEEEDLYDSLYNDGARKFSTFVSQGTILNNYSNIFTLITRMRQLSCHPDLVLRSKTGVAKKLLGDASNDTINLCRICAEEATEPIVSKCKHVFCRECVRQYLESASEEVPVPDCPYCHANLSINLDQEALEDARPEETRQGILGRLDVVNWRSSTKIEALVEELNKVRRDDSTIKSIVFSQFTSFLDLIAFRLQRAGFTIARLEGSMTPEARDRTVRYFSDNPSVTVFLVSLKAGGVALNLTEASRVFVMDPWWNAASIGQAADRIHRLGQTRPIIITNLIIENSIESRVAELSAKKMAMVNATLSNDDAASQRLTVADLQFLFRM